MCSALLRNSSINGNMHFSMVKCEIPGYSIIAQRFSIGVSEISLSRQRAAEIEVFQDFCQYFGLLMVYSVAISVSMTRYNTKTQKNV